MKEMVSNILKEGFHGHNTHVSPKKALLGLDADSARKVPCDRVHSCWEQLYHIVFWQDLVLEEVRGNVVDWTETHGKDWPKPESILDSSGWNKLVERFFKGLAEAEELLDTLDLQKPIPSWNDHPAFKAMLVLAQHNSYHIGQIVVARQALKTWPPPDEAV